MKTRLSLKRERLAELTIDDLTNVVGGNVITGMRFTCPVTQCLDFSDTSCDCCTASGSC